MSARLALRGRTTAITGASSGIGRAIALAFAAEGANVVCHYEGDMESQLQCESLVHQINGMSSGAQAVSVAGDIRDAAVSHNIVQMAWKTFGSLDVAVANAGICRFNSILDISPDEYRAHVDVNLNGTYFFVQAAVRQMKRQYDSALEASSREDYRGGSIIGISSISALVGSASQTHYTPTKAGIVSLMQSCAVALGQYRICCNALLPGTIQTRLLTGELGEGAARRRALLERIPLGRFGDPEDLAGPAVFLASDQAKYVTGAQLLVDGGAYAMQ